MEHDELREQVRSRYAEAATAVLTGTAASCCGPATDDNPAEASIDRGCCGGTAAQSCIGSHAEALDQDESFGSSLYGSDADGLPTEALLASLGCGNPTAVADLRPGETVLDLGSGGGIDVLLSAKRVGPTGFAFGLDMTEEMLMLARANATKAGAKNVTFLKGQIEAIPLPSESVDAVISNCVINLSTDKAAVLAEMFRVLRPGGRVGVSDVVAEDHLTAGERAQRGDYVGCIAGALSKQEYLDGLDLAGFVEASVEFTHEVMPDTPGMPGKQGMHGAIVKAIKPSPSNL